MKQIVSIKAVVYHEVRSKSKSNDWHPDRGFELFLESLVQKNESTNLGTISRAKKIEKVIHQKNHLKLVSNKSNDKNLPKPNVSLEFRRDK